MVPRSVFPEKIMESNPVLPDQAKEGSLLKIIGNAFFFNFQTIESIVFSHCYFPIILNNVFSPLLGTRI